MEGLAYSIKNALSLRTHSDPYDLTLSQLKVAARHGFLSIHRGRGWMRGVGIELDETYSKKSKAFYNHGLQSVFHESDLSYIKVEFGQIPTFQSRMKWMTDGSTSSEHIDSCGRILCVLRELADVRYGPMIPQIVSLLVPLLDEHEAFAVITSMCKRKGSLYFSVAELGANLQVEAFKEMLPQFVDKRVVDHMETLARFQTTDMFYDWFNSIFIGWLKPEHVLRVMDAFTVEGNKVLYRFSYGILKLRPVCDAILASKDEEAMIYSIRKILQSSTFNFEVLSFISFAKTPLKRSMIEAAVTKAGVSLAAKKVTLPLTSVSTIAGGRIPRIEGDRPQLLNPTNLRSLLPHLPQRLQQRDVRLVFSSEVNGWNLSTLYDCSASHGPNILIIRTKDGKKVGCFASHAWRLHQKSFGNAHCNVFESHSDLKLTTPGEFHVFDSVELSDTIASGKPILDEDEQWVSLPEEMFPDAKRIAFSPGSLGLVFETDMHGYGAVVKSIVPDGQADRANRSGMVEPIHVGDVLISLNEIHFVGIEYKSAMDLIKKSSEATSERHLVFVSNKNFYATLGRGMPSGALKVISSQTATSSNPVPEFDLTAGGASVASDGDDASDGDASSVSSASVRPSFDKSTPYWTSMSPATFAAQPKNVYMITRDDYMMMGGTRGQSNSAIKLYQDMHKGSSEVTETFNNYPLHGKESTSKYFDVLLVELYVFVVPVTSEYNLSWSTPSLRPKSKPSFELKKSSFERKDDDSGVPKSSFDFNLSS